MDTLGLVGGTCLRPDGSFERADVTIDRKKGTITAIEGETPASETLDANGCLIIPGLINGHTHVAMTLFRGVADDKPLDSWLREDIWPLEGEMTREDVAAGAALGCLEMIKNGVTTFQDMYFHVDAIADVVETCGLRAILGHTAITAGKDSEAAKNDVRESIDQAISLEGDRSARIHGCIQPHSLTTVAEWGLRELAEAAADHDLRVHLHANETRDEVDPILEEHGCRPIEYAEECGLLSQQTTIAHGVHLDSTEMDRLAATNTGVMHCPAANMKLASGLAPVQAMNDHGVTVGIGTDGPASNNDLDVLAEINDAALIGKIAADDAAAVKATRALKMATMAPASTLGLQGGEIAVGRPADIAVVDLDVAHLTPTHNPVSNLVYAARGSDVVHTICDGKVLMRDRTVETLDSDAVKVRASERVEALLQRVG